ncbi:MAG TPA: peptidoglycan DD-metalloendopeptidase family protein [Bacteroidales bacterium]|nr:peptidoglycan DD-metalloendopeptidase family protein [Bacteroidales bacterium]
MKYKGIALSILSVILFFNSCNIGVDPNHDLAVVPPDSAVAREIETNDLMYGIPSDSFTIVQGKIRKNSFISDILLDGGVPMPEIDQALRNSSSVFDVRKVQPGKNYALFCEKETGRTRYMIYEHNPVTTYVFSFTDSLNITAFNKEITTKIIYASGTINTSLWEAVLDQGLNTEIAYYLSEELFAWTIDFFGLEKGDKFKVVYEQQYIEDKPYKISKVLTAQFTSSGQTYTAIPFIQDGKESYFDIDGSSLHRAFLKAPLTYSRISSKYTTSRMHPVLKIRRPHLGVDYAAPAGTEVHSVGDGRVISVTSDGTNGRMVKIKHNSTYSTAYLHLSRFGSGIKTGAMVKQGQVIGYVGSSGLSTGPHLDFRFYRNGLAIDPLKVVAPPVEPVSEINKSRFEIIREVNLSLLNTL